MHVHCLPTSSVHLQRALARKPRQPFFGYQCWPHLLLGRWGRAAGDALSVHALHWEWRGRARRSRAGRDLDWLAARPLPRCPRRAHAFWLALSSCKLLERRASCTRGAGTRVGVRSVAALAGGSKGADARRRPTPPILASLRSRRANGRRALLCSSSSSREKKGERDTAKEKVCCCTFFWLVSRQPSLSTLRSPRPNPHGRPPSPPSPPVPACSALPALCNGAGRVGFAHVHLPRNPHLHLHATNRGVLAGLARPAHQRERERTT